MGSVLSRRRQKELTADSVKKALRTGGPDIAGTVFRLVLLSTLVVTLGLLIWLIGDVIASAQPYLSERGMSGFLNGKLRSTPATFGVSQAIRGSLIILAIVGLLAFPLGVAAAVYLEEYAAESRFTRLVDLLIRNLAGVPAVIYGILGIAVFKEFFGNPKRIPDAPFWKFTGGPSVLSAGLIMAVLVLPVVIITAAEAIRAVPQSLREAGFGVGATRSEVVRSHVLPYAAPGILTGTILAFARALGEAAPVLMIGAVTGLLADRHGLIETLQGKFTALPIVVYSALKQPASKGWPAVAAATILVLLVVLVVANTTAIVLRNHFERKRS